MDSLFLHLSPPLRTDWRFQRAIDLLDQQRRPPAQYDDHYVRACYKYVQARTLDGTDALRTEAIRALPHVHAAHEIRHSAEPELKDELEARVLTGQGTDDIAKKMAIEQAVVNYYEKIYFDARERLKAKTWIAIAVLRPPSFGTSTNMNVTQREARSHLLRMIAYHGGELALEAMLKSGWTRSQLQGPEDVHVWLDKMLGATVSTRALAEGLSLEPNGNNAMRLMQLSMQISSEQQRRRLVKPIE